MRWHEISVLTTEEAADVIAYHFQEQGAGGVAIEESGSLNKRRDTTFGQWYDKPLNRIPEGQAVVKGYFPEHMDHEAVLRALKQALDELPEFGFQTGPGKWMVRLADEEEWANAWKEYYKPVRISPRMVVKPVWEPYQAEPGEIIIEIDPGMAFGTGTHESTALCLRMLERFIRPGDSMIDVGTGSGILAIAAAKLGASRVLALDLDPVAVTSASHNVALNGLEAVVEVRRSDLLEVIKTGQTDGVPVRVVAANILAEIILTFLDDVYRVLEPGGIYLASGIIAQKEEAVAEGLKKAGFDLIGRDELNDWTALAARKR